MKLCYDNMTVVLKQYHGFLCESCN